MTNNSAQAPGFIHGETQKLKAVRWSNLFIVSGKRAESDSSFAFIVADNREGYSGGDLAQMAGFGSDCIDIVVTPLKGISIEDIGQFVKSHKEAALYSSNDETTIDGTLFQGFLDEIGISDDEALKLIPDCLMFIAENQQDLLEYVNKATVNEGHTPWGQAGWDFWLTRQGHGVGYWDRDGGDVGDKLTEVCTQWYHSGLYIGDDGLVYVS